MEILTESTNINDLKQTSNGLCWALAIVISTVIVTVAEYFIHPGYFSKLSDISIPVAFSEAVLVLIPTIVVLQYCLKYLGKKTNYWFLWTGPVVDVYLEHDQTPMQLSSWLDECLPKHSYYIYTSSNRMTIKFKTTSDLVFFRTGW